MERIRELETYARSLQAELAKARLRIEWLEDFALERCEHPGCEETDIHHICDTHMNTDYPPEPEDREEC